jgi:hypothetical protein
MIKLAEKDSTVSAAMLQNWNVESKTASRNRRYSGFINCVGMT